MQDKVTEINPEQKLIFLHCIIHQEVLCKSVLKINPVIDNVTKVVNSIGAKALNHSLLCFWRRLSVNMVASVTRQLSDGSTWVRHLKRVWDLRAEIREFCKKKGRDIIKLSDAD